MKTFAKNLWLLSIGVRLLAFSVLLLGPWTDSAAELEGWDVERFHAIAEAEGEPYLDFDVEYPPGSIVVIEALSIPAKTQLGVVGLHRSLLVAAFAADLLIALVLRSVAGIRATKAYLILGLPLVPMGLLRLDLMAALFAVLGFWALVARRPAAQSRPVLAAEPDGPSMASGWLSIPLFAISIAAGALVKVWPILILGTALALRRFRHVGAALAVLGLCGMAWLVWVGDGLSPVIQVVSLRGATGWHVESTPGSIVSLFSSNEPRLELNAFRIGTSHSSVILAGRIISVGAMLGLISLGYQRLPKQDNLKNPDNDSPDNDSKDTSITRIGALVSLGCVASLVLTAPLLSPQFILWLTPWAAILGALSTNGLHGRDKHSGLLVMTTATITVLTGATLVLYGPAGVADTLPAFLLVVRNLLLAGLVGICLQALRPSL